MKKNIKIYLLYIIFFIIFAFVFIRCNISRNEYYKIGTSLKEANNAYNVKKRLFKYPINLPEELKGNKFDVKIDGEILDLYKDINAWNQEIDFAVFELSKDYSVNVKVKPNFVYDKYVILSNSDINYNTMIKTNISSTKDDDGTISFSLNDSNAKISIVFSTDGDGVVDNDDYHNTTLHLFTNLIDNSINESMNGQKDNEGRKIVYYGPGFHDLYASEGKKNLTIGSNTHIYISGGAIFATSLRVTDADNVLIDGSGIVMSYNSNGEGEGWPSSKNGHCIKIADSSNVEVKNILSNSHFYKQWTTIILNSTNVKLDNYKTVSTQYASTDGLDIINSQNVTVTNSFFRACDDAITIKGLNSGHEQCKWTTNKCNISEIKNININNSLLWNDANNSMVLGHEAKVDRYSNINFKNIYVLYNNDDRESPDGTLKEGYYHNALNDRSVMSIVSIDGSVFNDINWNSIYVNEAERLINLNFLDYSYNGSWKSEGNSNINGEINGVKIKNVVSDAKGSTDYSNQILISGYTNMNSDLFNNDPTPGLYSKRYAKYDAVNKKTKNVHLSNITINKNKVDGSYFKYKIGPYVSDLTIDSKCIDGIQCTIIPDVVNSTEVEIEKLENTELDSESQTIEFDTMELNSLKVNDNEIELKTGKYEYIVNVENNITSVKLTGELKNSKSARFVDGFNLREINDLKEGNNEILIKIIDDNNRMLTYKIIVNRLNKNEEIIETKEELEIQSQNNKDLINNSKKEFSNYLFILITVLGLILIISLRLKKHIRHKSITND